MAAAASCSNFKVLSRNIYAGETKNNLRNGYGIYKYANKFFQYEGEWMNGKKHGHGKLVMADGTYYEGEFSHGEITGHGFKRFSSGQHYTGEFIEGEPQGHGIMTYSNGLVYEGYLYKNQKSGYGILRAANSSIYEGYFHADKRHGDGSQIYGNGDRYDGEWVSDHRHGHGEMIFNDGSIYKGQFRLDTMSGLGTMTHASGVVYEGLWVNNRPRFQPVKLNIITDPNKPLEITQGDSFQVKVECLDSEGNVVELDQGRQLKLTAGFRNTPPQLSDASLASSRTSVRLSDAKVIANGIETPFGYAVTEYPLNDFCVKEAVGAQFGNISEMNRSSPPQTVRGDSSVQMSTEEMKSPTPKSDGVLLPIVSAIKEMKENIKADSCLEFLDSSPHVTVCPSAPVEPYRGVFIPPPLATKRTEGGCCDWSGVKFSPPPHAYPPYQALDAIKQIKKGKKLAVTSSESDDTETKKALTLPKAGEYVLMVHDVTDPPFMGNVLQPAFAVIIINRKKKPPKKPKANLNYREWDTKSHITHAMARRASIEEQDHKFSLQEELEEDGEEE